MLAGALRVIGLNQQLWLDEIATLVNSVSQPLGTIVSTYTSQNQHTFYSILAQVSVNFFGEQPWALRLPAVLFGVASVPALYFLGRLLTTRREALLASALMVVSYHHVWFSQNARGYTGLLFFTLVATSLFIHGLKNNRWSIWLAYSPTLALGLYTHLGMGFVAIGHAVVLVWLLAVPGRKFSHSSVHTVRPIGSFFLAALLSLMLYAPMMPQLYLRTVGQAGPSIAWEWNNPLWMLQEGLRGLGAGTGLGLFIVAVAGLLAATGLISYWRSHPYAVALMLLPCAVTFVVLLVLGHNLWPRFFFFAQGFGLLFLVRGVMASSAVGTHLLQQKAEAGMRWGTALVMFMIAASAWSLAPAYEYPKQDFLGAMQLVDRQRQDGEPVLTVGLATFPYRRYYRRDWRPVETRAELESVRAQSSSAWLLYTFPIHLKHKYPQIWNTIQADFTTVGVFPGTLGGGEVYVCRAKSRRG